MKGVAFRFSDLRSLFHYASKSSVNKKQCVRKPKRIYQLYQNYRSHSGRATSLFMIWTCTLQMSLIVEVFCWLVQSCSLCGLFFKKIRWTAFSDMSVLFFGISTGKPKMNVFKIVIILILMLTGCFGCVWGKFKKLSFPSLLSYPQSTRLCCICFSYLFLICDLYFMRMLPSCCSRFSDL